jgi:predicted HicB family RNase H-like nuclease
MPTPKPKRVGRPTLPKGNAKDVMLRVRLTPDDLRAMKAMAKANGQSVSEWTRGTLRAAANA